MWFNRLQNALLKLRSIYCKCTLSNFIHQEEDEVPNNYNKDEAKRHQYHSGKDFNSPVTSKTWLTLKSPIFTVPLSVTNKLSGLISPWTIFCFQKGKNNWNYQIKIHSRPTCKQFSQWQWIPKYTSKVQFHFMWYITSPLQNIKIKHYEKMVLWEYKQRRVSDWEFSQSSFKSIYQDHTWAWRYISPETISRKYFLAVFSPKPPGGPEPSQTHLPSTYSRTRRKNFAVK